MEILGRKISDTTKLLIFNVYSQLSKPVVYQDISHYGTGAFGAISENLHTFVVSANVNLPKQIFETNILHELFHGVQMTKKYPEVVRKTNDPLIEHIGSNITATVLDLEVNDNLSTNNFDSSYFFNERFKVLKNLARRKFDTLQDHLIMPKLLIVNVTLCLLTFSEKDQREVIELYQPAPNNILFNALELMEFIKQVGHDTPEKCFICFGKILNQLKLWDHFGIQYGRKSIATETHYTKVLNTILEVS